MAVPARAQESARHLTGEFITGFSGSDNNGNSLQGPYVGIAADFTGYWKDPRILTFEVQPNLFHGFQWTGPAWGPETNGIAASSTFLGGSHIPLYVNFSRQNIPTPDLGPQANLEFQGISSMQQNFGVDWLVNLARLPDIDIHYYRSTYETTYPADLGGTSSNNAQDFRVGAGYKIAGWMLHGNFDRNTTALGNVILLSNGQTSPGESSSQTETVSASRSLPLRSRWSIDFNSTDASLHMGPTDTTNSYERVSSNLSSRITDRLTTNFQTAYVTSFADYARQQILQGSVNPSLIPNSPLLNYDSAYLNYGGGATFRVVTGLFVHGEFSSAETLSNSTAAAFGDTRAISGGINYSHTAFGGNLSASYGASKSVVDYLVNQDSLTQTVTLAYSRRIFAGMQLNTSGDITDQNLDYTFEQHLRSYGFNADVSRRVGAGWNLRGHVGWRSTNQSTLASTSSGSTSFGVTASSRRLQLDVSEIIDNELAYQVGNTIVLVPGATPYTTVAGLPLFFRTAGNNLNVSATYQATRHLSLRGMWRQASRSANGANSLNAHGYDFRGDYRFRKMRIAGGYAKTNQDLLAGIGGIYVRTFYIELRRDFKVF